MKARRLGLSALLLGTLFAVGASPARSEPAAPAACVETPRPDPSLPVFVAQARSFGFHDEELVLCSPGAPNGGTPTHLSARLWVPAQCADAGECPGVVVVHGFGGTKETAVADMRDLATRGLYVLAYDVRGQGQSGGQADFMGPDTIADEAHVLQWFHDTVRPTKTGVYGISQGGTHALMAAVYNCGPARAAAFDSTVPCDQGGVRWVDAIVPVQAPARMETIVDDGTCSQFLVTATVESRMEADLTASATRCLFDGTPADAPVEEAGAVISDSGLDADNGVRDYLSRLDRIDVPVYLVSSYFDRLVPATNTTTIYRTLRSRAADAHDPYAGTDVRLLLSNDAHGDVGANFAVLNDVFTWLELQLKGSSHALRSAPVASQQEWDANSFRLEHDWPIPGTSTVSRFLGLGPTGGQLSPQAQDPNSAEVANVPVVSTGPWVPVAGSLVPLKTVGLLPGDSMRYETDPYPALEEITGLPSLDLWLSTPDGGRYGQVDITLEEITPDGTATQFARVRRGFADLSSTPSLRQIPLSTSSWRIDAGNRLRLTITATDVFEATPSLSNRGIVINHGTSTPSRLDLPMVDPQRVAPPGNPPSGSSFAADPVNVLCAALGIPCAG